MGDGFLKKMFTPPTQEEQLAKFESSKLGLQRKKELLQEKVAISKLESQRRNLRPKGGGSNLNLFGSGFDFLGGEPFQQTKRKRRKR